MGEKTSYKIDVSIILALWKDLLYKKGRKRICKKL